MKANASFQNFLHVSSKVKEKVVDFKSRRLGPRGSVGGGGKLEHTQREGGPVSVHQSFRFPTTFHHDSPPFHQPSQSF